jgi:predicted nucleic acid-binding Zn ribbon protein
MNRHRSPHDARRGRHPEKISEVMSRLLARRGYAQALATNEYDEAWREAVGPQLARYSRPGRLRRGVLEVIVGNSTVLQELTFRKVELLHQLETRMPVNTIQELRFRVGEIDQDERIETP